MRNTLLFIAILISLHSVAQNNILTIKPPTVSINPNKNNIDPMPNAMAGIIVRSEKIGNNGQRLDFFKSEPDNMIVLKPDSTFQETIPNAMDDYKLKSKSLLSQQLNEHIKNTPLPKNNEEYHFKLLKHEIRKFFLDSTQRKLILTEPSLQR
ncbi:MAG TPA: hypothetical protein VHP12_06315 [Chitinophagaceae bacterium]|nr:hypothetical protein [Chitinophagaceae bacterium]